MSQKVASQSAMCMRPGWEWPIMAVGRKPPATNVATRTPPSQLELRHVVGTERGGLKGEHGRIVAPGDRDRDRVTWSNGVM